MTIKDLSSILVRVPLGRTLMICGLLALVIRWCTFEETDRNYYRSLLKSLPHLPGRYMV